MADKSLNLQLNTILENIADGITVQDKEGKLIYVNEAALKACGVNSKSSLLHKDLTKLYKETLSRFVLMDEDGRKFNLEELPGRRALRGEKDPEAIIQYINNESGETYWSSIKAKAIKNEKGEIIQAVNIVTDITGRRHMEDSLKFKAEASKILSSSLDYKKTLKEVAELAVPRFSDWCVIDIIKNKQVKTFEIRHKDKSKIKWAYELRKQYPVNLENYNHGIGNVYHTKDSYFINNIKDSDIKKASVDKKHYELLKKVGFTSIMMVPIIFKDQVFGVISFINTKSKRKFTEADLELAKQIASRVYMAVENSNLYEEVINERKRLDHLLSNVPGVVWEAWGEPDSGKQRIYYVSKYVEKMLGYSTDEWLNTPNFWLNIVHPEDRKLAAKEAAEIFASGKSGISRFRWIKKNGDEIWVEAQSQVIKLKNGKSIGMRGVTMDITDRIEIEKRKDDFISMASHELKTPLTSMKLFLHMLINLQLHPDSDTSKQYYGKINIQLEKLERLVAELLNVSKIQAGKLELHKSNFSLQKLLEENIEDTMSIAHNRRIKLIGKLDKQIYADKNRIEQVLLNLLTNALKFSPKNDEIVVSVIPNGKFVVVGVEDHGRGIDPQHQEKVFERFYRVYDKEDKTYPGLGMGLYIAKQIIEKHEGQIWLESEIGKGSKFFFKLPYK